MKIVVTGSLGHIGKPLAEELAQKGRAVTVITSRADKQKDIETIGATAAVGSVEDVDFLASAFRGADAAYCMIPPNYAENDYPAYFRRIADNYAEAVQKSGVRRVIHLSSFGAHRDKGTGIIVGAHDAERILNELSNVAVTHLRPTYFYYNLLHFVPMIKSVGLIVANYGADNTILLVSSKDIAAVVAAEIETPFEAGAKNVRYVASDERTGDEIARVLGAAIGKPDLKWTIISDEQVQKAMQENGVPPQLAADLTEMYAGLRTGAMAEDYYRNKPARLGKVKLEDYAEEFARAFQPA